MPTPRKRTPGQPGQLSPKQQQAIDLILAGQRHTDVAKKVGVTKSTVSEWHRDPLFARTLSELRAERRMAVMEKIDHGAKVGIDVLVAIAQNTKAPIKERRQAATTLMQLANLLGPVRDVDDGKGHEDTLREMSDDELLREVERLAPMLVPLAGGQSG